MKLRARDPEDMRIVAACLQDALVSLGEIAYLKREKRFVVIASRFRWEHRKDEARAFAAPESEEDASFEDEAPPPFERVHCGLCFDRVKRVRYQGLDPGEREQFLNLLTIEAEPRAVTLIFSDGVSIRLDVGAIACHLEDLGEPWPTRWRPAHEETPT